MTNRPIPAASGPRLLAGLLLLAGMMVGCQADFGADITNRTPQPVFATIFRKGGSEAVAGASRRLGPGDRAFVGTVRTRKDHGAFISVYTMGNPDGPVTADLPPGESYLEIQQDGQGPSSPIRIVEKR